MSKNPETGLTGREEKFCQEYSINGGNASAAYRAAYSFQNMKEGTINTKACLMTQKAKIRKRLVELQKPVAEKYNITREFLTEKVMKVVIDSEGKKKIKSPEVLLRAADQLAKLHGLNAPTTNLNINLPAASKTPTARIKSRVEEIIKAVVKDSPLV